MGNVIAVILLLLIVGGNVYYITNNHNEQEYAIRKCVDGVIVKVYTKDGNHKWACVYGDITLVSKDQNMSQYEKDFMWTGIFSAILLLGVFGLNIYLILNGESPQGDWNHSSPDWRGK